MERMFRLVLATTLLAYSASAAVLGIDVSSIYLIS